MSIGNLLSTEGHITALPARDLHILVARGWHKLHVIAMNMADVKLLLVGMSQYSYAEIAPLKTWVSSLKKPW